MAKVKKAVIDKYDLTAKEALSLLSKHKEGGRLQVHSFEGMGGIIMGCDISLASIKEHFKTSKRICLAGPSMKGLGHGVAFLRNDNFIFLETDNAKLKELFAARKLDFEN